MLAVIPDMDKAKEQVNELLEITSFPQLSEEIVMRMGQEFNCWQESPPYVVVDHNHSTELSKALDRIGRELPLVVIGEISYGPGAGHPYFGVHRKGLFSDEVRHTYLYHATPGRVLKDQQASDYFRIDHLRSKPMLYCCWILTHKLTDEIAVEAHRRWEDHRFREDDANIFDCAKFTTDLVLHTAYLAGDDPNNPFNPLTPSNTVTQGNPEDRGMRSILRHAFHPPSLLIFSLDQDAYNSIITQLDTNQTSTRKTIKTDCKLFNIKSQ